MTEGGRRVRTLRRGVRCEALPYLASQFHKPETRDLLYKIVLLYKI